MLKTHKSVAFTGALLCLSSLVICKICYASLEYSFLYILLFFVLFIDFWWFTKDYHSEYEIMKKCKPGAKYMSNTAYLLKSILVLLMFMVAVLLLLVPMVMYQRGLGTIRINPLESMVLGHISIYLTQYAYELGGGVKIYE